MIFTSPRVEGWPRAEHPEAPAHGSMALQLPEPRRVDPAGDGATLPRSLIRPRRELEVLIPALNEESRLPRTLARAANYLAARPWDAALIVVDNGSVDRTLEVVERFAGSSIPVSVIGCSQRGKGAAVRRGLMTSDADIVGFMDADLATPIESLDFVIPLLRGGAGDVVIASRRVQGAQLCLPQPGYREVGGMVFRALARQVIPEIADTQCGFKFFKGSLARRIARTARVDGFAFDVELLRACLDEGASVRELPVAWSNVDGSTFRPWRDGLRVAVDLLQLSGLSLGLQRTTS